MAAVGAPASADEIAASADILPVPTITIYPGDVIGNDMLADQSFPAGTRANAAILGERKLIVGKVARRTLVPGKPITANAIAEPDLVKRGTIIRAYLQRGRPLDHDAGPAPPVRRARRHHPVPQRRQRPRHHGQGASRRQHRHRNHPMKRLCLLALLVGILAAGGADAATRIKDITSVQGVRDNLLIGYGLVIGLAGTGDTMRNAPFTEQSIKAMLDHLGVNVQGASLRIRNVAGVTVTADLPAFAGPGSRIDVSISSIGDATSLRGGTLLMTPMMAADGQTYAVAQGSIAVSGFVAGGQAETVTEGVATGGRISNGALVEREVLGALRAGQPLVLELRNPDFATATMIADRINQFAKQAYGRPVALERDMRNVLLKKPDDNEHSALPRRGRQSHGDARFARPCRH